MRVQYACWLVLWPIPPEPPDIELIALFLISALLKGVLALLQYLFVALIGLVYQDF